MSTPFLLAVAIFVAGVAATTACVSRVLFVRSRRLHYAVQAAAAAYLTFVYYLALTGVLDILTFGPMWVRPAVLFIIVGFIANVIVHWSDR